MQVRRLVWLGVPTQQFADTVAFFETVLGMPLERREDDFAILRLPDGTAVEVFGPRFAGQEQFASGPIIGLEVWDVAVARRQLESVGVAFVGPIHHGGRGAAWTHFRGPEGKVYELTQLPDAERSAP